MANIWDEGLSNPEDMKVKKKRRILWFVEEYFSLVEKSYRQREIECLKEESWMQHRRVAAGLLLNPALEAWQESNVSPFSTDFFRNMHDPGKRMDDAV